jgi:hypothetical protein
MVFHTEASPRVSIPANNCGQAWSCQKRTIGILYRCSNCFHHQGQPHRNTVRLQRQHRCMRHMHPPRKRTAHDRIQVP